MKRVKQYPYWIWEDYLNGMYDVISESNYDELSNDVIDLLGDPKYFEEVAYDVIYEWIKVTDMVMHNISMNRVAWLGQAACCYEFNIPEIVTRYSWKLLSSDKQIKANEVASNVIQYYERKYW